MPQSAAPRSLHVACASGPVGARPLAICGLALGLSLGCVTARFKDPIADFETAVDTTARTVGAYYVALNEFERELYFEELALNPAQELVATDAAGRPTPLLARTFSPESIRARMDAFALLGVYGHRLGELAGSDAPPRTERALAALGENLDTLAGRLNHLPADVTAPQYAGPVTSLVGVIGRIVLERKRDRVLLQAIDQGAPEVEKILRLLERDLATVIAPLRATGEKQILAERVRHYNANREAWSVPQRRAALEDIRATARRYEVALALSPVELTQQLRRALEALVTYARSARRPADLAQLNASLETFRTRAQSVGAALKVVLERER